MGYAPFAITLHDKNSLLMIAFFEFDFNLRPLIVNHILRDSAMAANSITNMMLQINANPGNVS